MLEDRINRRDFLNGALILLVSPQLFSKALAKAPPARGFVDLRDRHSQLESSKLLVCQIYFPQSSTAIKRTLKEIARKPRYTAICGAQHAGGGQQFADGGALIDTTRLNRVLDFDERSGWIQVESGIRWPALLNWLQKNHAQWTVRQKQTGNDDLTLGGALSANAHGQGLSYPPLIADTESFRLVTADGSVLDCSRTSNQSLFKLAIGGYGNFGLITSITLKLILRFKFRRDVQSLQVKDIPDRHNHCVSIGARYGDFQCNIDETSPGYLRDGIFSCYVPVDPATPVRATVPINRDGWLNLAITAHKNKSVAYERFASHHLSTSGSVDWPERWQSSVYVDSYHIEVDRATGATCMGSEVLTELYVPLKDVSAFIEDVRTDFLENKVNLIYSTVRFIECDEESFLPWARAQSACVIFNVHCDHTESGIAHTRATLVRLIDHAIKYSGRYYLTYHRFARPDQVLKCYPELPEFLRLKRSYDQREVFRSNWYRHYAEMFA